MTERVVSKYIKSNVFVVGNERVCVIVDAAAELDDVKNAVGKRRVLGVFLTHGHYDHCLFANVYAKCFSCKVYASEKIKAYLQNPDYNYSDGKFKIEDFSAFEFLSGEGEVDLKEMKVRFHQLGGHSKSDMCFFVGDEIFVGDVLLGRDMGRTDLYGGDKEEMKKSLQYLLDVNYSIMHAGHGADNDKPIQDKVAKLWLRFLNR